MNIQIKKASSINAKEHLIILATAKTKFSEYGFSKEELAYIESEIKDEKKNISVNQYKRRAFIQVLEGKKDEALYRTKETARKAGDKLCGTLNSIKADKVEIDGDHVDVTITLAFVEGIVLSNYQFLKYKTKDAKKSANKLTHIDIVGKSVTQKAIDELIIVTEATCKARTLVNEPVIHLTATQLSKEFQHLGKEAGFSVQVLDKKHIEKLKMGGLLAVNIGSIDPPTFTIMEYKPAKAVNKKPYVLVGKGVVYDTGGLSLKPTPNSMDSMKCDMGGSAAVACGLYAIAKAKLPVHVIALVPATDNRPGGNAYTPGDVITMHNGMTVEVLNTDAEGRMILADALSYAQQYKPELVLEFSTLTGAAAAAIGKYGIVAMGTASDKVKAKLTESGNNVYERLVEFPFWDEYADLIKSDIADLKNIGGPVGGAITAGKFLENFIDYPYMHFDIAGPAFLAGNDSYRGKNGTGVGVRLLFDFFKNL